MDQKQVSRLSRRGFSAAALLGFAAVAAARLLTLPQSMWELDETLFMSGVLEFEPLRHHPHPPGYPLLIGLGKLFALVFGDPFRSLVALSVVASLVGYAALVSAFRRLGGAPGSSATSAESERIGVTGALLFCFSPTLLIYGPLPLSDAPALMFLALFLAAAAHLPGSDSTSIGAAIATGVFASGAIGCRPQLALSVLPALAVALWLAGSWRRRGALLAAFTVACLAWFVPLVVEVGGPEGLVRFLTKQAGAVTTWDTTIPRAGQSPAAIAARFVAHPWGQKWTAGPVLALALVGTAALALARTRWKMLLPLMVLTGIELGFSLSVMNPRDAVRYALPSLIGIAFAAACGLEQLTRRMRVPALAWSATAALCAGFVVYAWPLLEPRSTSPSPPVQAAEAARRELPADAVLLVEKDYAAHAAWLLPRFTRFSYEEGMRLFAARPETQLWIFGETILPGAHTFLWPASDTYGKLTRALYRTTSLSPVPPEQRYDALRGVLAYEPRSGGAGFRWLEEDAVLRVFPRNAGSVALTLGLPEVMPGPQVPVRITIAGKTAAFVVVPRGGKKRVVLALPDPGKRGNVEIAIRSASSFVPVQAGVGGDPRRLAVQLHGVELLGR